MRWVALGGVFLVACNAFPDSLLTEIRGDGVSPADAAGNSAFTDGSADTAEAGPLVDAPPTATIWPANGHAYEIVRASSALGFDNARLNAKERGGHLATIGSLEESSFIKQLMSTRSVSMAWIGAYQTSKDKEPDGDWAWVTGEPWGFTRWASSEPNDNEGDEDFVLVTATGEWNDTTESSAYLIHDYVVEYE